MLVLLPAEAFYDPQSFSEVGSEGGAGVRRVKAILE